MRLINAVTFAVEEFIGDTELPPYAILSHFWEKDEVSFQDIQNLSVAHERKGFLKIRQTCELAVKAGYDYVWVDTCCIDKSSSAELSEAINSMYRWYEASEVCYVFLADVSVTGETSSLEEVIMPSRWFTRGWTLQELLAPQHVEFYNSRWELLGTKQTLAVPLSNRTGIDEAVLNGEPLGNRSIAQRMSWASNRKTTRIEDIAYCLLGIFDVNMPLLYGEGSKAFLRLQEQIIRQSDDHSIFAWPIERAGQHGLLAECPNAFAECQNVRRVTVDEGYTPYSLTNRGLSLKLIAMQYTTDTYAVRLNCAVELQYSASNKLRITQVSDESSEYQPILWIFLRRLVEDDQYARVEQEGFSFAQMSDVPMYGPRQITVHVQQNHLDLNMRGFEERINGFRILYEFASLELGVEHASWDSEQRIMSLEPLGSTEGNMGHLYLFRKDHKHEPDYLIRLGFDFDFHPVIAIATTESGIQELRTRSFFGDQLWSNITCPPNIFEPDHELTSVKPGVTRFDQWLLRGNRANGLYCYIPLRVQDPGQYTILGAVRIQRGDFRGRVIWYVYIVIDENAAKRITGQTVVGRLQDIIRFKRKGKMGIEHQMDIREEMNELIRREETGREGTRREGTRRHRSGKEDFL